MARLFVYKQKGLGGKDEAGQGKKERARDRAKERQKEEE